jgi:hypothetical protein
MIKNKLLDIKQRVLKKYVGTFCEASSDQNEAVTKIRQILNLDDTWEASYKVEDFSNNVVLNFTNGSDIVEIKFISCVGGATSYSILVNEKRIVTKDEWGINHKLTNVYHVTKIKRRCR